MHAAGARQRGHVARLELPHVAQDRPGRGDVAVADQQAEGVAIDLRAEVRMRAERLQLRAEEEATSAPAVVERLLADPVPGEDERLVAGVPEGEGEHAVGAGEGVAHAPLADGLDQHLGVRVAAEAVSGFLELPSQLAEVVDLAVVRDDVAPAARRHGLRALGTQVDDREPAMAQRHAAARIDPGTAVVGAAVAQRVRHLQHAAAQRLRVRRRVCLEESCDATHGASPCVLLATCLRLVLRTGCEPIGAPRDTRRPRARA